MDGHSTAREIAIGLVWFVAAVGGLLIMIAILNALAVHPISPVVG